MGWVFRGAGARIRVTAISPQHCKLIALTHIKLPRLLTNQLLRQLKEEGEIDGPSAADLGMAKQMAGPDQYSQLTVRQIMCTDMLPFYRF